MVDIYRANRQFERFLMDLGHDLSEPPDDRKTLEDMQRYPKKRLSPIDPEEGTLIATIHYFPDEERVEVERHVGK